MALREKEPSLPFLLYANAKKDQKKKMTSITTTCTERVLTLVHNIRCKPISRGDII